MRERSPSFADYFSQPRLFWLSQTKPEQRHIINAFSFELSKVGRPYIRERILDLLTHVDHDLAKAVAANLGITLSPEQLSRKLPKPVNGLEKDPALSLYAQGKQVIKSRRVALLVADGVNGKSVDAICKSLKGEGVHPQILAPHMGTVTTEEGAKLTIDGTIEGTPSVLVDAVLFPDGEQSLKTLEKDGAAKYCLRQAYKHLKPLGLVGGAKRMLKAAGLSEDSHDVGLVMENDAEKLMKPLIEAMKQHRIWAREDKAKDVAA